MGSEDYLRSTLNSDLSLLLRCECESSCVPNCTVLVTMEFLIRCSFAALSLLGPPCWPVLEPVLLVLPGTSHLIEAEPELSQMEFGLYKGLK